MSSAAAAAAAIGTRTSNTSPPLAVTTTASTATTTMEYDVMYYKRALAGKVHRGKGVAKFDGVLTIIASAGVVSLRRAAAIAASDDDDDSDDDDEEEEQANEDSTRTSSKGSKWNSNKKRWKNATLNKQQQKKPRSSSSSNSNLLLYSGVQRELAIKQLREDDVLVVAGFEVQVLGVRSCKNNNSSNDSNKEGAAPQQQQQQQNAKGTTTATPTFTAAPLLLPLGAKNITPSSAIQTTAVLRKVSVPLQSKKRAMVATGTTPATIRVSAQVSATVSMTKCGSSNSRSTLVTKLQHRQPLMITNTLKKPPAQPASAVATNKALMIRSTANALLPLPQQQQPLILSKRPLLSSVKKNPASVAVAAKQQRRSAPKQPLTSSNTLQTAVATAGAGAMNDANRIVVLPHIPLPADIRNVLRPHQVQGVDFLWTTLNEKKGCILGDEMGLGKTLMTIACLTALHRRQREKQFIVVCPSSLVTNWANEFDKWLGRASQPKRVVLHKGGEEGVQQIRAYTQKMKQQLMHQPGQVLIVSYDLFRRNSDEFVFPVNVSCGLLVVDEGHRLKNTSGSLTLSALESLPTDARLCITATPIQNNLCEFYNLVNFCCPGVLGTDVASFRKQYERPIANANQKNASREQLATGLAMSKELETVAKTFMLRRLQKDILKSMLPPRTEALLFCRPSARQCQLYYSLTKHTVPSNMTDALTTLTALRKICSHPFLHKNKGLVTTTSSIPASNDSDNLTLSGKLVVLDALLQQIRQHAPDEKVVIVSNFTSALSIIELLVLQPRQFSYLRLDGTTKDRQAVVDTFNRTSAASNFCFMLSSKAGGCGLNIVGANRMVMFDADWNPSTDVQAMGRIYRQGQTKPCTIYRLFTSGTVEEVIYQRQSQKGGLATLSVDAGTVKKGKQLPTSGNAAKFTREELADCFTLKENCACDTKQKIGIRWPEYDVDGLRALGCTDAPLLSVAKSMPDTLRFVHITNDDETLMGVSDDKEAATPSALFRIGDENDSDSENEFSL